MNDLRFIVIRESGTQCKWIVIRESFAYLFKIRVSQVQSILSSRSPLIPWLSAVVKGYFPQPHWFLKSSKSKDQIRTPPRFKSLMNFAWRKYMNICLYVWMINVYLKFIASFIDVNYFLHYAWYILVTDPLITFRSIRSNQILRIFNSRPIFIFHIVAYLWKCKRKRKNIQFKLRT